MFNCQNCQNTSPANSKAHHIVIEKRTKIYPWRKSVHRVIRHEKEVWEDDYGGEGWEIARELIVCEACALKLK
jgi:hypothetical protein